MGFNMGVYEKIFFHYFERCREICNTQGKSTIFNFFILLGRSELRRDFLKFQNYIILKKNCEITQILTLSIHTFLITNFKKSLHSSDLPSNIKKYQGVKNFTLVARMHNSSPILY